MRVVALGGGGGGGIITTKLILSPPELPHVCQFLNCKRKILAAKYAFADADTDLHLQPYRCTFCINIFVQLQLFYFLAILI